MSDRFKVKPKTSQVIYEGRSTAVGLFRSHPKNPNFGGPHIIGGTLLVFPRTSVTITHIDQRPVLADPNIVMLYNNEQIYTRSQHSPQGDICEWFCFEDCYVAEAIQRFNPAVESHPHKPFDFVYTPTDATTYLLQRLVVDHILSGKDIDPLFVEETLLTLLRRVIFNCYRLRGVSAHKSREGHEQELAMAVREVLAMQFSTNVSLEQIAGQLSYSPFHLCRVFQKHMGQSIHQYLKHLRLRTALEFVTEANVNLTDLALKSGFASHSHFTEAFRRTFGAPPSAFRSPTRQHIHELHSKISIA